MKVTTIRQNILYNKYTSIRIIDQGHVLGDNTWRFHSVTSPFHRLYYIISGVTYVREKGKVHCLESGKVYLMKRNVTMDYYAKADFEKYYLHFQYPIMGGSDLLEHLEPLTELVLDSNQKHKLIKLFEDDTISGYANGMSVLYEVLAHELRTLGEAQQPKFVREDSFAQLLKKMEEDINVSMTVEDMAKLCGKSVSDFSRKFKEMIGIPPKSYLHNLVLDQSKMLLVTTALSIKEIAYEVGFRDNLYFSRFFKKYSGLSPLAYRKNQI